MNTIRQFILLLTFTNILSFAPAAKTVAEEGLFLDGVEGVVRKTEKVDVWNFVPAADIVLSEKKTWPAQSPISLLPCAVLEQITGLAGEDNEVHVRLWGLFTEYEQNNYLYSVYFLPIEEDRDLKPAAPDAPKNEEGPPDKTDDADEEDSIIPTEILRQIKSNKAPDLKKFQQIAAVTGDINLIGRSGYLKESGNVKYFQPDAFGQNVSMNQYLLLPCSASETAEKQMQKTLGRPRYRVSGLVTTYKGRQYMLLRRAVRTYTNGNFTP